MITYIYKFITDKRNCDSVQVDVNLKKWPIIGGCTECVLVLSYEIIEWETESPSERKRGCDEERRTKDVVFEEAEDVQFHAWCLHGAA